MKTFDGVEVTSTYTEFGVELDDDFIVDGYEEICDAKELQLYAGGQLRERTIWMSDWRPVEETPGD